MVSMMTPRHEWQPTFLDVLRKSGNVTAAACTAGIARQEVYRRRQRDQCFAQAWDDAVSEAVDALESELKRRAFDGVEQPVFYQGEVVGTIQAYSDRLAMFLLKGLMPERYGDHVRLEAAVDAKTQELAERYGLTVGDVQNRARRLLQAAE